MDNELKVLEEVQKTYRKVNEILDKLGTFPDCLDSKSTSVIDSILSLVNCINIKLVMIEEEVNKL
jgi:hypothetical protein